MTQPSGGDYSADRLLSPTGDEHLRLRPTDGRDEISLYDIWQILTRRWRLVLTLFAIVAITAVAIAMALPKRYVFTSMFEIGQVASGAGTRLLEPPEIVGMRLEKGIIPRVRREVFGAKLSSGPQVKTEIIAGQGVVTLSSVAPMSEQRKVQAVHTAIFDALSGLHTPRFEQEVNALQLPLQNAVTALTDQEQDLRQQIASITQSSGASVEKNPAQNFLLASLLADLRLELTQLRGRLADRKREMESIRLTSRDTRIAEVAIQADRALGPSRALIVALGCVLGIVAGVVVAFVVDFLVNARQAAQLGVR